MKKILLVLAALFMSVPAYAGSISMTVVGTGVNVTATATVSDADLSTWLAWCQAVYLPTATSQQCLNYFANATFTDLQARVSQWKRSSAPGVVLTPNQ